MHDLDVELYEMMRNIFTDDVGHFDQEGCSQFYAMTAELADITYDMLKGIHYNCLKFQVKFR